MAAVNSTISRMVSDFTPYGIIFSFADQDYVDNDDFYDFCFQATNCDNDDFVPLLASKEHEDGIDIYFLGPGVWDNGAAPIIGDPLPGSGINVGNFTGIVLGGGNTTNGTPITSASTTFLTHEMGHALGLLHTNTGYDYPDNPPLADNCREDSTNGCNCGDYVADTSPDPNSASDVTYNSATGTCSYNGSDIPTPPWTNIMSRSDPECWTGGFTNGQVNRMKRYLVTCDILQQVTDDVIRIGFDMTWDQPLGCLPDVLVLPGAQLTITSAIDFQQGKKIIVQPGGKLVLDAGVLSTCDSYWDGIVVEGNASAPQIPFSNQGFVNLVNSAVIRKATTALTVLDGGIVLATSSQFENNKRAVTFMPYNNPNNFSGFTNCDFIVDGGYDYSEIFIGHVGLIHVNRVAFQSCTFKDARPVIDGGAGIASLDASFTVKNSEFKNQVRGISAFSFSGDPESRFTVANSTFTNNQTGIFTAGVNNFDISENNQFSVGGFPTTKPDLFHIGVQIMNGTAFDVEGNTFIGKGAAKNNTIGILTVNSGTENNDITGNTYDFLNVANQAEGLNGGDFQKGLQYLCNKNLGNNVFDFFVADSGTIAAFQGNGLAARNVFSHSLFDACGDFDNEGAGGIVYFHLDTPEETPQTFCGIENQTVVNSTDCPGDGEGPGPDPGIIRKSFHDARDSFELQNGQLLGLLDGGEPGLSAELDAATGATIGHLIIKLLAFSPYLSGNTLKAAVAQQGIIGAELLDNILILNPDELRKPSMREFLYVNLPVQQATQVLSEAKGVTERTTLESEIARFRSGMQRSAKLLIREFLKDTTGVQNDSLRIWLANKESPEADYAIAETWLAEGKANMANQVLDAIPVTYELTAEQLEDHEYYRQLTDFLIPLLPKKTAALELSPSQLVPLEDIANNSSGLAGARARGLLEFAYGYAFPYIPKLPGGKGEQPKLLNRSQSEIPSDEGGFQDPRLLTAFPNPAKDQVAFNYELPETVLSASIVIMDSRGLEVARLDIGGAKGNIAWNTGHLDAGIYLYYLDYHGKKGSIHKLVLLK